MKHLRELSHFYPLDIARDYSWLIANKFLLPPGYNAKLIPVLMEIPEDYPLSPPGVGSSRIYLPKGLRYHGSKIKHYYESINKGKNWCWFCYQEIRWNPRQDNLILFLEMVRSHLTNPEIADDESLPLNLIYPILERRR